MSKKLSLRQINYNKARLKSLEKSGFSLLVNPNPKLGNTPEKKDNGCDGSQNVATKENSHG